MEFSPYFSCKNQKTYNYTSDLFQSYGSPCGIDVIPEIIGNPTPLSLRHPRCRNNFSAKQPCCPLQTPNRVVNELAMREPCMSQILEENAELRRKLQSLQEYFNQIYGKRRGQTRLRKDINTFTQRLKNISEKTAGCTLAEEKEDLTFGLGREVKEFTDLWCELVYKDIQLKKVNYKYSGGLLTCQDLSVAGNDGVLLHHGGPSLQTLYCSTISNDELVIKKEEHVDLEEELFQVDSRILNNSVWCIVRHKTEACLYRIQLDDISTNFLRIENTVFNKSDNLSSISLSPYLEGEYLMTTENGDVYFKNSLSATKTKLVHCEYNFECDEPYWGCDWSMHPREICITNRTGVLLYDIRTPDTNNCVGLFSLPHSLLNSKERVYISRHHPRKSYYRIISTDKTIVLTDQRFPNHPVLHWKHLLPTGPSYIDWSCEVTDGGTMQEDVLLLGSQLSGELHCMQMTPKNEPGNAPAWTCVPWRVSPIRDIYRYTSDEGLVVDPLVVSQRLKAPLAGIATLKSRQKHGFTALQLTSLGDLFYQTYEPCESDIDKTKAYGFGSKNITVNQEYLDICQKWLKEAETLLDKHYTSESSGDEENKEDKRGIVGDNKGICGNRVLNDSWETMSNTREETDTESRDEETIGDQRESICNTEGIGEEGIVGDNRVSKSDTSNRTSGPKRGSSDGSRPGDVRFYKQGITDVSDIMNELSLSDNLPHAACCFCHSQPDLSLEDFTCTVCATDTHTSRRLWQGVQLDFPDIESPACSLESDVLSETSLVAPDTYSAMLLKLWNGEMISHSDLQKREEEWLLKNKKVNIKEEEKEEDSSSSSFSDLSDTDDEVDEPIFPGFPSSQGSLMSLLGLPSFSIDAQNADSHEESMASDRGSLIHDSGSLHTQTVMLQYQKDLLGSSTSVENSGEDRDGQSVSIDNKLDEETEDVLSSLGIEDIKKEESSPSSPGSVNTGGAVVASASKTREIMSLIGLDMPQKNSDTRDEMGNVSFIEPDKGQQKPPRKRHRRSSTSSLRSLSSQSSARSYASSVLGFGATPNKLRKNWLGNKTLGSPLSVHKKGSLGNSFSMTQSPTMFKSPSNVKKKKRKSVMGF